MKIEHLINDMRKDLLGSFLYLERYVNFGSKTYSPLSNQTEVNPLYQPTGNTNAFEVPCLLIPKEEVSLYIDHPNQQLFNFYIQEDKVLFPIHPEIFQDDQIIHIKELKQYSQALPLVVSPTASSRTVMTAVKSLPYFVKLHYPKRISRFMRRLRKNIVQNCIEVSKDLDGLENFAYLPESLGITYGTDKEAWGFILREFMPRPHLTETRFLIPLFALYSQDMQSMSDPPLLTQLIHFLNKNPKSFTLDHIMKPIIRIWCTALRERGIILETHGQNTLLELNSQFHPTRIVYRDLDVYVDPEIRKSKQLHLNFSESHLRVNSENREKLYSLNYDAFTGHHLFDYLSSLLEKCYGINPSSVQNSCREAFHHYFPDANLYFTDKTFYYSDKNKYDLIETNQPPKWR